MLSDTQKSKVILCCVTDHFEEHGFNFAPRVFSTGLMYIQMYCLANKQIRDCYDIEVIAFHKQSGCDRIVRELSAKRPDIIGFSCFLPVINLIADVAKALKQILPETLIVFGGPMAFTPETGINPYPFVDVAVHFEGELPFEDLLLSLIQGRPRNTVRGITYRIGDKTYSNEMRDDLLELSQIPSCYSADFLKTYSGPILYETSRGCKKACSFCSSVPIRYREHSMDRVKHDLSQILNCDGISFILLTDNDLGINIDRFKEILHFLIEHNYRRIQVMGFWTITKSLVDCVPLMKQAGFIRNFPIPLQSGSPEALKLCHRKWFSLKHLDKYAPTILGHFPQAQIELILGLPGETAETFKNTFITLFKMGFRKSNVFHLILCPGSELFTRIQEFGLTHYPNLLVRNTREMSVQDRERLFRFARNFQILSWLFDPSDISLIQQLGVDMVHIAERFEALSDYCDCPAGGSVHFTDIDINAINELTAFIGREYAIPNKVEQQLNAFLHVKQAMLKFEIEQRNQVAPALEARSSGLHLNQCLELHVRTDILEWLHISCDVSARHEPSTPIYVLFSKELNRAIPTASCNNTILYDKVIRTLLSGVIDFRTLLMKFVSFEWPTVAQMVKQLADHGLLDAECLSDD